MKGLLKKDILLISERKIMFVFVIIIGFLAPILGEIDISFVAGYTIMLFVILGLSTLGYDESDNCLTYIMTMPITRKTYVQSKYIVCILSVALGGLIGILIAILAGYISGEETNAIETIFLVMATMATGLIGISVGIPANIKFGAQKGAAVMLVTLAMIALMCVLAVKMMGYFDIDVEEIFGGLASWDAGALIGAIVVVTIICMGISYSISQRVIMKKEF